MEPILLPFAASFLHPILIWNTSSHETPIKMCSASTKVATVNATLTVDASSSSGSPIPDTFFGIFFDEINHAGAGELWAELVSNRGFEAGGPNMPSYIDPWEIIGNASYINVETDRTSLFDRNKIALRLEVLCNTSGVNICPTGGVGVYNPDQMVWEAWLQLKYRSASEVSNWTKVETILEAKATDHNARLQLTTTTKGVIWLDQVSAMPQDTYKGHGFRTDLYGMLANIQPRFIRFPGGCFVEGVWLRNAFRWNESVGPWEERPGHFGDVWMYWTDDGLGYFEFLQLAEDLGALPIWVFNNGISHREQVDTTAVLPFVQEALDRIEFARGDATLKWGSLRAAMGHPEPFDLKYVAVGNEDCGKKNYRGNYLKFFSAIRSAYPDIQIISNCDASSKPLDHLADLYDHHVYTNASNMFVGATVFDRASRSGPKAFVSEYAVIGSDAGTGSLRAALAEAGFLIGLERNSDVVHMVSYAPLFVNTNDRRWNPDAIVFNSYQLYGTPSYWVQLFFLESNGNNYIRIKVVNFDANTVNLHISFDGLDPNKVHLSGSTKTLLTSSSLTDENSFSQPKKVVPIQSLLQSVGREVNVVVPPYSFTSFDFLKNHLLSVN
ncbi:aspartate-semialdehyde dehydrogenase-like protein [Stylosanthes scabra]|uniref:non-reducing end alpha-L-arabinofuranosidase n=1 Tax=Stylosanthes scabra TaxID=79078 RepID=A0ABU6YM89_9FABA|nr:aspartate-semialdehyde dehydrogenase-like protein [Stylosanthes scabra]